MKKQNHVRKPEKEIIKKYYENLETKKVEKHYEKGMIKLQNIQDGQKVKAASMFRAGVVYYTTTAMGMVDMALNGNPVTFSDLGAYLGCGVLMAGAVEAAMAVTRPLREQDLRKETDVIKEVLDGRYRKLVENKQRYEENEELNGKELDRRSRLFTNYLFENEDDKDTSLKEFTDYLNEKGSAYFRALDGEEVAEDESEVEATDDMSM